MKVFTCYKKSDTDEYHLFEGNLDPVARTCTVPSKSICKKMNKSEKSDVHFACQKEADARLQSAKHGRAVCGTCVSHLYASY